MIFASALERPTVFVMLCEKDIQTMRSGRTLYLGPQLPDGTFVGQFDQVVLSYEGTDEKSLKVLEQARKSRAMAKGELAATGPMSGQEFCPVCNASTDPAHIREGRCYACWVDLGKKYLTSVN